MSRSLMFLFIMLMLLAITGCRLLAPLPPTNLNEPGWQIHTGQAVWHLPRGRAEIAGEVLVATRTDGSGFIQFTKTPFPLVSGTITSNRWAVEFPAQKKHYAGPGLPPKRIIWLYLPRVIAGQPAPQGWSWHYGTNQWRLENPKAREAIEGYFDARP